VLKGNRNTLRIHVFNASCSVPIRLLSWHAEHGSAARRVSRTRSVFRQLDFRLGKSDHNVSGCFQRWIVRRRSSQREIRNPAAPDRRRVNVRLLWHASLQQSRILRSL
jgi:hypothetical protein